MLPDIRQSKRLTVLYHLTPDKTAAVRNEQRLHSIFFSIKSLYFVLSGLHAHIGGFRIYSAA